MKPQYTNIQWVVQKNLTGQVDFDGLRNACAQTGVGFVELNIIPFTLELPDFDRSKNSIIYGSTTFNSLAYESEDLRKGIFFDAEAFSIENYIARWGRYMLNYSAVVTTFKELIEGNDFDADKLLFIRPDNDSKSFAGDVKRFDELREWYNQLQFADNTNLSPDSKIVVAEPYNIHYEWRLWIVNKKVIAASKYREYFQLKKEKGCPDDVIAFAEDRCREYTPHDVFVMDICLCGDEYFIIECGCMNAAGLYHADIGSIVSSVTEYFYNACAS